MDPDERLRRRTETRLGIMAVAALNATHLMRHRGAGAVEAPALALWRSACGFTDGDFNGARSGSLDTLLKRGGYSLLPEPADIESILGTILAGAASQSQSSGPTLTTAACDSQRACLNVVARRWSASGRLMAKARMGVFIDTHGSLCWEFGVVGERRIKIADIRSALRIVQTLAGRRGALVDLTPSHRPAAWLALRLGAQPADARSYRQTLRRCKCDASVWQRLQSERLLVPAIESRE
jgi:hypothetical protein